MDDDKEKKLRGVILDFIRETGELDVDALVSSINKKLNVSEDKILETLRTLSEDGLIQFSPVDDTNAQRGEGLNYFSVFSVEVVSILIVLSAVIAVFLVPPGFNVFSPLRWVLSGLVMFLVPGYALQRVVFRGKDYDLLERLGLAFGFSMGISALSALCAYAVVFSLDSPLFLIIIAVLTAIFCCVNVYLTLKNR